MSERRHHVLVLGADGRWLLPPLYRDLGPASARLLYDALHVYGAWLVDAEGQSLARKRGRGKRAAAAWAAFEARSEGEALFWDALDAAVDRGAARVVRSGYGCPHCHELNWVGERDWPHCWACGHRADLARLRCDCRRCVRLVPLTPPPEEER